MANTKHHHTKMRTLIIGYGAWGQALQAIMQDSGHNVTIATRKSDDAIYINAYHAIILAVPVKEYAPVLQKLAQLYAGKKPPIFIIVSKGMNQQHQIPSQILHHYFNNAPYAVLSGPNFAHEIKNKKMAMAVLSATDEAILSAIAPLFHCDYFKIYYHYDPICVQYLAALKNIYAIGAGIINGLELGDNIKAAYITRACAEMTDIVEHMGANKQTVFGLSGLGDFLLTASSSKSRNTAFGILLAQNTPIADALKASKGTVEGYYATTPMYERYKNTLDIPILTMLQALLSGNISIQQGIESLFNRPIKAEL